MNSKINYNNKYLKYKKKYLELKSSQLGGWNRGDSQGNLSDEEALREALRQSQVVAPIVPTVAALVVPTAPVVPIVPTVPTAVAAVPTAVAAVVQNDINVLVICSDPRGKSFPKEFEKSDNILNRLSLSESEFKFTYTKNFPTDVEHQENKTFDIIWFAGCNVLKWIFNNNGTITITDRIKLVYNILKDNGKVIFTENTGYIRKYSPENENKISTKIELIKSLDHNNDNFKETHECWYTYFKLIETDKDFYYIKK